MICHSGRSERISRKQMGDYYVYMMTNDSGTLYVGVTNDLQRRAGEHRDGAAPGFTSRYRLTRLVYFEHA